MKQTTKHTTGWGIPVPIALLIVASAVGVLLYTLLMFMKVRGLF